MSYILDTNIFIRCKNEMPMDIFRGFWQAMARLAQSGLVFSSVKVKEEIEKGTYYYNSKHQATKLLFTSTSRDGERKEKYC